LCAKRRFDPFFDIMAPISTDDLRSSTVKPTKIQNTDIKKPIATSMAEPEMPSYPGLGRWTLLETMGKGGFSNVYRAEDSTSEYGEVAIKVMRKYEMNKQQV
jgi:serine/threonine protein kinase